MVTVRELARSQGFPDRFVFYAIDGDVKTVGPGSLFTLREVNDYLCTAPSADRQRSSVAGGRSSGQGTRKSVLEGQRRAYKLQQYGNVINF